MEHLGGIYWRNPWPSVAFSNQSIPSASSARGRSDGETGRSDARGQRVHFSTSGANRPLEK